eukprot:1150125-Pelagomonas_calceolata.AAC.1
MAAVDPGSVCSRFQNAPETIIFSGPPGPGPLKLPFSPDQHKPAPPAQAKSLINFPVPGRRELPCCAKVDQEAVLQCAKKPCHIGCRQKLCATGHKAIAVKKLGAAHLKQGDQKRVRNQRETCLHTAFSGSTEQKASKGKRKAYQQKGRTHQGKP